MPKPRSLRDGLNSGISPSKKGASGGRGLPPRTHAIHKILYRAQGPLSLGEIEKYLTIWGYDSETVEKTREHLRSLCEGWTVEKIIAARKNQNGWFELTEEGRSRLSSGLFSDVLQ